MEFSWRGLVIAMILSVVFNSIYSIIFGVPESHWVTLGTAILAVIVSGPIDDNWDKIKKSLFGM